MIWHRENNGIVYAPAEAVDWSIHEASLVLAPDSPEDQSFLAGLQPSTGALIIGHGHRVGICEVLENRYTYGAGAARFVLRVRVRRSDFTPPIEMSLGGTSADKLAEMRARRLLLNEKPYVETRDINTITEEIFIQGQETVVQVTNSPFPELYQHFGSDPTKFLSVAWITAAAYLKLSACVVEVVTLQLSLIRMGVPLGLNVSFKGRRKKQYQNRPAHEVIVEGTCGLT
jgi:hypothetical protein